MPYTSRSTSPLSRATRRARPRARRRHGALAGACLVAIDALESRRLMAITDPWGDIPQLIRQDHQVAQFPLITGKGQAIAILDTGIDYTHPLLGGDGEFGPGHKVVGGWDFVDDDADPMDNFGHGTAVAGVIGAEEFTHEGRRYRGIAPG